MNAGAQSAQAFFENNGRGETHLLEFRASHSPTGHNPKTGLFPYRPR
jgi:hypothetical protein